MVRERLTGLAARGRIYRAACIALAVLVAALLLGACGGDDDDDGSENTAASTTSTTGGAETVAISETEFVLTPADPSVKAGEVTFDISNDGQTTHSLAVEGPGGEQESDEIEPGQSTQLTVDLSEPGTYEMYCPISNHRQLGMEGEIKVSG